MSGPGIKGRLRHQEGSMSPWRVISSQRARGSASDPDPTLSVTVVARAVRKLFDDLAINYLVLAEVGLL
jgi:hypothetical protein